MRINAAGRAVLDVWIVGAALFFHVAVVFLFSVMFTVPLDEQNDRLSPKLHPEMAFGFAYLFCSVFTILGCIVWFMIHVMSVPGLSQEKRISWLVFLYAMSPISVPAYWFLRMRPYLKTKPAFLFDPS